MRLRSAFLIVVGLLMSGVGMPVQALDFDSELDKQEAQVQKVLPKVRGGKGSSDVGSKLNTTLQLQDREFRVVLISKKSRR